MTDFKKPISIIDIKVPPINLHNMPVLKIEPIQPLALDLPRPVTKPKKDPRLSVVAFLLRQHGGGGADND